MTNIKLRECPFCGGGNIVIDGCQGLEGCNNFEECTSSSFIAVVCDFNHDGCGASSGYYPTKVQAIEAWNRRAERGGE
jgi:Lar family restriction alleviation protein